MISKDHTISLQKAKKTDKKLHSNHDIEQIKSTMLALEKTSMYLAVETDIQQIQRKLQRKLGSERKLGSGL
jgi:hypothetical protein